MSYLKGIIFCRRNFIQILQTFCELKFDINFVRSQSPAFAQFSIKPIEEWIKYRHFCNTTLITRDWYTYMK